MPSPRIVLFRAGALGDVILTLPAIHALRRAHPGAHITVVGYSNPWEVAGEVAGKRLSIDHPAFAGLYGREASSALTHLLAGTDLAIAWTARDITPALRSAGVRRVMHASPYPPPGMHAADWLVSTIQAEAGPAAPDHPLLPMGIRNLDRAGAPIYLHPGAGAPWKRWPAERFAAIGQAWREDASVALIEGPADAEAVAAVQAAATTPFPVVRNRSLSELASLLAGARLVIGNDSGITHLAAATGAPALALFGPTDPASWRPLGPCRVLRACTSRTEMQGQIRTCFDPDCMAAIPAAEVLAAAEQIFGADVESSVDNLPKFVDNQRSAGNGIPEC